MGPTGGLNVLENRKILLPLPEIEKYSPLVHPLA
jgi:hypothetical protein